MQGPAPNPSRALPFANLETATAVRAYAIARSARRRARRSFGEEDHRERRSPRRQGDRPPRAGGRGKAIVRTGAAARSRLGDSASEQRVSLGQVRTPAFWRSGRPGARPNARPCTRRASARALTRLQERVKFRRSLAERLLGAVRAGVGPVIGLCSLEARACSRTHSQSCLDDGAFIPADHARRRCPLGFQKVHCVNQP